jgi:hypothetical protein
MGDGLSGVGRLFWDAGESRLRALFRVLVVCLVTGGAFGPEGGLVIVAALAVGTALLALWLRQTGDGLAVQKQVTIPDLWYEYPGEE